MSSEELFVSSGAIDVGSIAGQPVGPPKVFHTVIEWYWVVMFKKLSLGYMLTD